MSPDAMPQDTMQTHQLNSVHGKLLAYEQGAHLGSWKVDGVEQLFMSRDAKYAAGVALRGGVPICFPQFAAFGSGQKHGFARNIDWQLRSQSEDTLTFTLSENEHTRSLWPHPFALEFSARLAANKLSMRLQVQNTGAKSFEFGGALHSYFRVDDIQQVSISGLQGLSKWDNGDALDQRAQDDHAELAISGPIDRVYFNAPESLLLNEGARSRRVSKRGFSDVVIWNPWLEGAQGLQDMADDEYQNMICIEAAIVDTPVPLAPGETWVGEQIIDVLGQ